MPSRKRKSKRRLSDFYIRNLVLLSIYFALWLVLVLEAVVRFGWDAWKILIIYICVIVLPFCFEWMGDENNDK